jgi:WD40 repeat protein
VLACKAADSESWSCAKSTPYQGEPEKPDEKEVDAILALSYTTDGAQIAVGHWTGEVEVWDANFSAKSRLPVEAEPSLGPVYSLTFFDACGRRQLAIGKARGLLYRPADRNLQTPGCVIRRSASVGDETYGIAFHGPSGLLAAATRGGYIAVLDPAAAQDPLATMVPAMPTEKGRALRGAIVAEAGSTAWLAVPIVPTEPHNANLALRRLRDGQIDDGGDFIKLPAGEGVIQRLSGSPQQPRLATLGCLKAASARTCARDSHKVVVWRLEDGFTRLTSLVALGARDFDGLVPSRLALSPDGLWVVISFERPATRLLVASLDGRGSRNWIETELQFVREIAFSQDGKSFAAGGAALQPQAGAGVDQVQLWTVGGSRFERSRYSPLMVTSLANKVSELAFAADQRGRPLLLAGGEYGAIDRWDIGSGRLLGTLRADSRPISQIAFSRSESLVAAADSQNVVRLWDTARWIPLQLTQTDRVQSPGFLAFGGNGAWLASGADRLQLWDLDVGSLQRKVCALLREPGQRSADSPTPMWRSVCEAP